jgi:hypothetical protein
MTYPHSAATEKMRLVEKDMFRRVIIYENEESYAS